MHVPPGTGGPHCGGTNRGANTWWKSYGVDEPSSAAERRQRPWSNADAYTVCGSSGSSAASLTPKVEPLPFQTSVNVAPPSVDSYSPTEFAPGGVRVVPPFPITCESPRTPSAEAA